MRVPLSWLEDYVDLHGITVEEIAYRMTLAGFEVDSIEYIGIPVGEIEPQKRIPAANDPLVWERDKLVIGHILEIKDHPDADRLVLAMVESGIGEVETCVTGAPNLFQYKGRGPLDTPLTCVYAREGATVYDPYSDEPGATMVLKPRKLRGIENKTMVCSEKEIGLSEEHEGILIFETDAKPGTPLQDVLGDAVLIFDLTPNLARAFSIIGIAREVAAIFDRKVKYPSLDVKATGQSIEGQVDIEIREPELNRRFTLALIKDVKLKPSPWWVQRRLRLAGMRPISNMVDVTNYVMMETGQPLHAFDYDILLKRTGGKPPTIITRLPEPGEKLTTLDDVERELDPYTILVADTEGSLSFGGIMGGAESEINDDTRNVLLEAANWNLINLRMTLGAQRERGKAISSEAATRFSRGVHPEQAMIGLKRGIEMMRQLGNGEIAEGIIDAYPLPLPEKTVNLPFAEVERIVGLKIPPDEIINILERLEFKVEKAGSDAVNVTVPDFRMDIGVEDYSQHADIGETIAQADLIEEVARIYGYDRIPNTMLIDELPPQRNNPSLQYEEYIRDVLVKLGLQETVTYRFTTPEAESRLAAAGSSEGLPDVPYVTLANPISSDKSAMRHTLLASMMDVLTANTRWRDRQAMFEIGKVYLPSEGEQLPDEPRHLCLALTGPREVRTWQSYGANGVEPDMMDFFDIKGVVEALLDALHIEDVRYEVGKHGSYFPGRVAALYVDDVYAGELGQLHPKVVDAFELPEQPVLTAELDLDVLLAKLVESYVVEPLSTFPAIYQDIAVVVDEGIAAAEVESTIWNYGGDLLQYVELFDVYRDAERLGEGKKSLAYALTFQAPDRTLKDKDAAKAQDRIVKGLQQKLGAQLRG